MGGGGAHALKRIPRIKFPQRHSKPLPSSDSSSSSTDDALKSFLFRSASGNTSSSSGKASDQPKRTPVSNDEIEAILLGGYI